MRVTELRGLTGVRGIAALIVFLDHVCSHLGKLGVNFDVPEIAQRLLLAGGRQVDIFFVLSGLILTLNYRKWFHAEVTLDLLAEFFRRRLARIYPLHCALLIAMMGVVGLAALAKIQTNNDLGRFDLAALPEHFLLIQALDLFGRGASIWNPPSWSISVEALAYVLFPFLLYFTSRHAKRHAWLLLVGTMAVGLACNAMVTWGIFGIAAIARALSEFSIGCMIAYVIDDRYAAWLKTRIGSFVALAILCAVFLAIPSRDTNVLAAIAAIPLLISLSADNPVSRFMGWRPVYFLGEISYSIYLGHFLFAIIAYRLVPIEWMKTGVVPALAGLSVIVAFVLVLSTLSYYLIEKPGRNFLVGRRTKKSTASAPQTL